MNTYQAKKIPLRDLLSRLGHEPQREDKGELWYLSPFRTETEASFHCNIAGNVWYDFGEGAGGNVIDFALRYFQVSGVADALRELDRLGGLTSVSASPVAAPRSSPALRASTSSITVTKLQPVEHRALINYLQRERRLDAALARQYLQEIHYTREGKPYYALAFASDSGGYELRNAYYQGAIGQKDITLHPGQERGSVAVFEGFMDFLSALTFYKAAQPKNAVIVLNSTAMKDRAIETITRLGADTVMLYLDHDAAGRQATTDFQRELKGLNVLDQSAVYAGFKDFNDYLKKQRQFLKQ